MRIPLWAPHRPARGSFSGPARVRLGPSLPSLLQEAPSLPDEVVQTESLLHTSWPARVTVQSTSSTVKRESCVVPLEVGR